MYKSCVPINVPIPTRNSALECIEPLKFIFNFSPPYVPTHILVILRGGFLQLHLYGARKFIHLAPFSSSKWSLPSKDEKTSFPVAMSDGVTFTATALIGTSIIQAVKLGKEIQER